MSFKATTSAAKQYAALIDKKIGETEAFRRIYQGMNKAIRTKTAGRVVWHYAASDAYPPFVAVCASNPKEVNGWIVTQIMTEEQAFEESEPKKITADQNRTRIKAVPRSEPDLVQALGRRIAAYEALGAKRPEFMRGVVSAYNSVIAWSQGKGELLILVILFLTSCASMQSYSARAMLLWQEYYPAQEQAFNRGDIVKSCEIGNEHLSKVQDLCKEACKNDFCTDRCRRIVGLLPLDCKHQTELYPFSEDPF